MTAFGYYNLRHTARGYKFSFAIILLFSLFLSFSLGTLLFAIGFGKNIDDFRRPLIGSAMMPEDKNWNDNKKGLLSGTIKSFDKDSQQFVVSLISGEELSISAVELGNRSLEQLVEGSNVRIIIAHKLGEKELVACVILPIDPLKYKALYPKYVNERKLDEERINICKGVRPYQQYKKVFINN
jgi:hypothetical protein